MCRITLRHPNAPPKKTFSRPGKGFPPSGKGIPPSGKGIPPSGNGFPRSGKGISRLGNGFPRSGNPVPRSPPGVPRWSNARSPPPAGARVCRVPEVTRLTSLPRRPNDPQTGEWSPTHTRSTAPFQCSRFRAHRAELPCPLPRNGFDRTHHDQTARQFRPRLMIGMSGISQFETRGPIPPSAIAT